MRLKVADCEQPTRPEVGRGRAGNKPGNAIPIVLSEPPSFIAGRACPAPTSGVVFPAPGFHPGGATARTEISPPRAGFLLQFDSLRHLGSMPIEEEFE